MGTEEIRDSTAKCDRNVANIYEEMEGNEWWWWELTFSSTTLSFQL